MHFRKLHFKNACRFEDFQVDLKKGSVGVFGKNGIGKSTLLNFMYAIPTNDFSRFEGVKTDCIRYGAPEKAESFLYGEIEHNDHLLCIKRNFKPTKNNPGTVLVVDGGKEITDANKAEEEIGKILGVDKKMLGLYAFKTQDRIYDFLTTTPTERAKAFAVLCRTEVCEEMWDFLGEFLNKDSEINAVIVDNSDELLAEIAALKGQIEELDASIKQEEERLLNSKSEASARDILKKQDRKEDLLGQQERLQASLEESQVTLAEKQERLAKSERVRKKRAEDVESLCVAADDAKAALKAWDAYKKYRARRKALNVEAEALDREEEENKPPVQPKDYGKHDLDALRKQVVDMESALDRAKAVVAKFQSQKIVACPTCNTPVTDLADHLNEQRKIVLEYPKEVERLDTIVETMTVYDNKVRKYEKWSAGFEARRKANQDARAALKGINTPDGDEADLNKVIEQYQEAVQALTEIVGKVENTRRAVTTAEAAQEATQKRLAEVAEGVVENTVDAAKVERARERLEEHIASGKNIARIQGEWKGVQAQIESKEEDLRKLRNRLKRSKKVRAVARVAERVRDVLHRDRLPRRVAATNLSRMEGDINEGLGYFGDPFWVESDESLQFTAHKPGEPPQPALRLSTGQKVVLAMAFWPAVGSLWQQDLGMLALDEPTANLDEENRKFLSQALGAMSAKCRGRRQLILVTHDPNLANSFDQVIKLET